MFILSTISRLVPTTDTPVNYVGSMLVTVDHIFILLITLHKSLVANPRDGKVDATDRFGSEVLRRCPQVTNIALYVTLIVGLLCNLILCRVYYCADLHVSNCVLPYIAPRCIFFSLYSVAIAAERVSSTRRELTSRCFVSRRSCAACYLPGADQYYSRKQSVSIDQ